MLNLNERSRWDTESCSTTVISMIALLGIDTITEFIHLLHALTNKYFYAIFKFLVPDSGQGHTKDSSSSSNHINVLKYQRI